MLNLIHGIIVNFLEWILRKIFFIYWNIGKTAMDLCISSQNQKCIRLLEEKNPRTSAQAQQRKTDTNTESESNSFPTTETNSNSRGNLPPNKQQQISKFKSEPNLNTETYGSEEEDNTSQLISASKTNRATLNNIKNSSELTGMRRIIYDVLTNNKPSLVNEGSDVNSWSETSESAVNFLFNDFLCIFCRIFKKIFFSIVKAITS